MRDDFPKPIIEAVGKRVGYLCSRPDCRKLTVGPHSEATKATIVGVAAHICAASPGGPRYVKEMTPEERSGIENAIWLCATHATEIDKDAARFPVSLLRQWKDAAEREAASDLGNARRQLGLTSPILAPPLVYQKIALSQVVAELEAWGKKQISPAQLDALLAQQNRDGINPMFEPLTTAAVADALEEMVKQGRVAIKDQSIVLPRASAP